MGGEVGEVGDGVGEDGEVGKVVDGVILSSSSKFVGDEDRETECACVHIIEREGERETKIKRMTEICHQVDRSVSERVESKVGNDSIGMLLQR